MGNFGHGVDRRRAMRLAQRVSLASPEPLQRGNIPPGSVYSEHASVGQLVASGVNFDRAGFAYDSTQYNNYTVNSPAQPTTKWTKVGANAGNLRLGLGDLTVPVYIWVWASFSWANGGGADHGRAVICLWDTYTISAKPMVRATNVSTTWLPGDGNFREYVYIGFLAIDPGDRDGTLQASGNKTNEGDWNIGMEQQMVTAQGVANQSANRQSIIAFVTAFPPDGTTNAVSDAGLG